MKIRITQSMLAQGKSKNGGFNDMQIAALGVEKTKGWYQRLINSEIDKDCYDKFLSLTDATMKPDKVYKKRKVDLLFEPVKDLPWKDQYLHPNWQRMRLSVLNRDNFTCVDCKNRQKSLHVHHLKYLPGKMIWEVPTWYLVTLCEDCHSKEHGRDLRAKKTY